MKKITLMILVSLMSFCGFAQGLAEYGFEDPWTGTPGAPPGWQVINEFGPNVTWTLNPNSSPTGPTPPFAGSGAAYLNKETVSASSAIPRDWLVSSEFTMPANGELYFMSKLTVNGDLGGSSYRVYIANVTPGQVMTPANFTASATQKIVDWTETTLDPAQQSQYIEKKVLIPGTWTGLVRIAFVMEANNKDRWLIDNVRVSQACNAPTTLTASNTTLTTADLSWTNPGGTKWEIETVLEAGVATGAGEVYTGGLPFVKGGLAQCTSYKYYVRQLCSDGGKSDWVGPFFFKTRCLGETCGAPIVIPPTLPYSNSNNTANFTDFYEGVPGTGCNGAGNYLAGNDVVYSFTPAVTGNVVITLTQTNGPAGLFVYANCAAIGVNCLGGGTATATVPVELNSFPVVAGTTYYIVISTNGTPQTTGYTLAIQQGSCPKPTAGTATATGTTASLSWTPGTVGATGWEVVVQPVGGGIPTGAGTATGVNASYPVTASTAGPLTPATSYEYYVRENCPGGTFSIWSGPFLFSTTQVPASLDYTQNFDGGPHGWTLSNGTQANKWVVGTAVSNSPGSSLYISNDSGVTNSYTTSSTTTVHAYRDIQMPSPAGQLSLSYDWRCFGEGATWDYIVVWVVPATYTPVPGTQISVANSGGQQVGTIKNLNGTWSTSLDVITAPAAWDGTVRRLVFEWRNDGGGGSQPPGAIDNINLSKITCPQPTALTIGSLNQTQAVINWTAPAIVPGNGYDIYSSTTNTPPTGATLPTGSSATTSGTITPLTPSATYYVWVRSNCSSTDKSFWTGPISFNTPQIPANMNFTQNFDGGAHNFTLSNGTQTNKWFVGPATFNSPANSLYISENNGLNNTYNVGIETRVHAYRDILMPPTIASDQLLLKYDWKIGGEGTPPGTVWDYVVVWVVPVTYSPTPGTRITTANSGGVQIGALRNLSNNVWITQQEVINAPNTWDGTVRRLIFEWNSDTSGGVMPGAAIDNINLSVITCPAPSALTLASMALGTATFTWTPPASVPAGYDYYYSESATAPTDATVPTGSVGGPTATLNGLPESTSYNMWVRSNCGATDGTSFWIGPVNFITPQTPATMDYSQNFDLPGHGWALNNGTQVNKWVVGTATSNSPANSLYISNDNGTTNAYTITTASVVQTYRDIMMPTALDQLSLTFDWKGIGQANTDYFRVWMVPITYSPVPGTQITAGTGRVQIAGNFIGSANWKSEQITIYGSSVYASTPRRLVFEWRNDAFTGTQPPAAIDNINLKVVTCPQPTNLQMTANTAAGTTFTWTAPTPAPATYDYFLTPSPVPPTATATPSGSVTTNTVTLTPPVSSNFYFYVRSNCGATDQSFWTGPINFNTVQVPGDLNYTQNFDGATQDWALSNGTQANKWYVGPATFNSPSNSLYISDNNSVTNTYNTASTTVVHAYRDLNVPASAAQIDFNFDWKAVGEGATWDYIKVWLVPVTFTPTPGTEIGAAAGRVQVGGVFNLNPNWVNVNYTLPTTGFAGGPMRVVFQWRNDGGGGTNPPGAIDNINIKVVTCPQPTALSTGAIGMTQAAMSWTETGAATAWEVYVNEPGQPAPTATTDGVDADTNTGFIYNVDLEPGNAYQYYVRSVCGPGDLSRWSGPFQFNTSLCEIVDQCLFNFIMTDSGNNGWQGNTITVSQSGIPIVVLGPQIGTGAGPVTVSVPLCSGLPYEVFFNKIAGGPTSANQVGLAIVNPFNSQTVFNRAAGTIASDMGTLLYTGIAYCEAITCEQPSQLLSESVVNAPNTTKLSWSPGGTETQWEVLVQPQSADFPESAPTGSVIVNDDPEYVLGGLTPGVLYEYYVRAICGTDDMSFWSGPLSFSIFTPAACADVTVLDPDLEIIAPDTEYVLCPGDNVCVDFSANFYAAAAETTSYAVDPITYALPFPTLGGTEMDVKTDDIWSPKVVLPFEFCFFGQVYNAAQVGSNGIITFNADKIAGSGSGYAFNQTIPNPTFPQRNAIYGVYQDTNPDPDNNAWDNPNINYQVLGNYPCRALVVSFNELAQFNCSTDSAADQAVGAQSSQIVLYEITNIIEVYVKRRVPCLGWQGGVGLIGVQNNAGTAGFTPPGRNTGPWQTSEEAWRFTPNGAVSTSTLEWFKNGDPFSTDNDIEVCADPGITIMTARASYAQCSGEIVVRETNFTIKVEEVILPETDPADIAKCGNGEDVTFDLNVAMEDVFTDPTGYVYSFYTSEAAATAGGTDNIAAPEAFVTNVTVPIWVRIMRVGYPCFIVKTFDAIISNVAPVFTITPDFSICEGTSGTITVTPGDFTEGEATYAWTKDGGALPDTTGSITVTETGAYEVTVTKIGCVGTATTNVIAVPVPVADAPADVTACDSYTLPALTSGNYFRQPGGVQPIDIVTEGDITFTQTIYVYAESDTTPNCTDENSFLITINATPTVAAPDDQVACDSYVLPALANAGNNYYTGPGGTGTMLNADDVINTTQTIYVYEETGTVPNCSNEDSFTVTINTTPIADEPADVTECVSYILPALSAGNNYYTAAGGTGTMLSAGETITASQVIYVYAQTGTVPNCTDESSFNVTITPTPQFNLGGPYVVCLASNATITVNPANFNIADATFVWTLDGAPIAGGSNVTGTGFGTYSVTVTVNGCEHTESVVVSEDTTVIGLVIDEGCDGNDYMISVTDVDGSFNQDTATYAWTGPNGFTSTDREFVAPVEGTYTVIVTTEQGCTAEATSDVLDITCQIPRGISPNGDGKNDSFDLTSLDVRKLEIFNRYGQEVYSKGNYTNEWHGQGSNGDELPTGTYYYMIERQGGQTKTGWVYINRQE